MGVYDGLCWISTGHVDKRAGQTREFVKESLSDTEMDISDTGGGVSVGNTFK